MKKGVAGALVLAGAMTFVDSAEARPVSRGTMKLAAERMTGFAVNIPDGPGDAYFSTSVFGLGRLGYVQNPRVGFDYFVTDGLSLGGSTGVAYEGLTESVVWHLLPRIGYAFALSPKIDFWPRGGLGVVGYDGRFGADDAFAVLNLEAMFIWNFAPQVGLEFGPTLDVVFDLGTAMAGNVGLVATF